MRSVLVISSFLLSYSSSISQSLRQHQWEDRVILIFANSENNERLQEQLQLLQVNEAELKDRDLVTYQVFDQKAFGPDGDSIKMKWADQLRSRYNKDENPFFFILIGKDGGVKLRSDQVVGMEKLFALIDGMPMRRAEMRKKDGK